MAVRTIAADRFRPLVIQALVLPLLAMVAFGGVLLWRVTHVLTDQWWVDHTDQVIDDANTLHTAHLRAESDVRGYLLTKLPSFREAFDRERATMDPGNAALMRMVDDNSSQVQAVEQIRLLRQQWLTLIEREFALRDSDGDWMAMVKNGEPRQTMQQINDAFQRFVGVEEGLRNVRTERTRSSFKLAVWMSVGMAAFIGLTLALLSRRQLAFLSQTYDQALQEANESADVLEKRVAERTAALEAASQKMKLAGDALRISNDRLKVSNRELQDFASVASHDLQEPLRKVQAFGDRLKAKSAAALGPEGSDYLDRMLNAATRMKTLINDLLTFARVTSRAQPFQKVDLKLVADQVISDLETRIEQQHATVEVGELPVIDADVTQMRQVMQNLIGNALKFSKPGEPPRVHVTASVSEGVDGEQLRLRVQDHGIGFEEKYLDRIFTVFQRLHGRNEYEGTGIGLAVCRKIVERHRGTITAESRLGEGAVFIVDLPTTQPDIADVLPGILAGVTQQEIVEAASA